MMICTNARGQSQITEQEVGPTTGRTLAGAPDDLGGASQPDVILCSTTPVTVALHGDQHRPDRVYNRGPGERGFVASPPRPGGNITGYTQTDSAESKKA